MFDYNQLNEVLHHNVCLVTFVKVDGSTRKMRCTLKSNYLPENYDDRDGSLLTEGDGVQERLSVFDLDLDQWRSFRVSSVKDVRVLE